MSVAIAFDRPAPERWHLREIGLWMFLGTVFMLFAAFTSAYVVRKSGGDWVPVQLPRVLWLNTLVLLASSVFVERAKRLSRPDRAAVRSLAAGSVLAALFFAGQLQAWNALVRAGVYLSSNPASSFFYILTGVHAAHLLAATGVLAYLLSRTVRRLPTGPVAVEDEDWPYLAGLVAIFWHFLTAVWIYLLLILRFA